MIRLRLIIREQKHLRCWPDLHSGQASVECALSLLLLFVLACPCVEFGRMTSDATAASSAAVDLARAVAANPYMTHSEQECFLERAYPAIAAATHFSVKISAPQKQPYIHRFRTRNGETLERASFTTSRSVTANLAVSRKYITPTGALLAPVTDGSTQAYEVSARGSANRDETVERGDW